MIKQAESRKNYLEGLKKTMQHRRMDGTEFRHLSHLPSVKKVGNGKVKLSLCLTKHHAMKKYHLLT